MRSLAGSTIASWIPPAAPSAGTCLVIQSIAWSRVYGPGTGTNRCTSGSLQAATMSSTSSIRGGRSVTGPAGIASNGGALVSMV